MSVNLQTNLSTEMKQGSLNSLRTGKHADTQDLSIGMLIHQPARQ